MRPCIESAKVGGAAQEPSFPRHFQEMKDCIERLRQKYIAEELFDQPNLFQHA